MIEGQQGFDFDDTLINIEHNGADLIRFISLEGVKSIAIDTETKDPYLKTRGPGFLRGEAFVCGISLYTNLGEGCYLPISHSKDNLNKGKVIEFLKQIVRKIDNIVFANNIYDLEALDSLGIDLMNNTIHDVQIIGPMLDCLQFSYSLDALSHIYGVGRKLKGDLSNISHVTGYNAIRNMDKISGKLAAPYAVEDARLTMELFKKMYPLLISQRQLDAYKIECAVSKTLWKMRKIGCPVNREAAQELYDSMMERHEECMKRIRDIGYDIDINKPRDLISVAKDEGCDIKYTLKGNESFKSKDMENYAKDKEVFKHILEAKKTLKIAKDFVKGVVLDQTYGTPLLRTEWKQMRGDAKGAITGRITSSNPCLTQIPSRHPEYGALTRRLFCAPDDEHVWLKYDYSQQEPRILISLAESGGYAGGHEAAELYRSNPKMDYHNMVHDLILRTTWMDLERKAVKALNLGMIYGMGVDKLTNELCVPIKEAQEIIDAFHASILFVKKMSRDYARFAERHGYIRTLGGRRIGIDPERTYKALNNAIQGSAADQLKVALVELDRQGYIPVLQVYDEVNFVLAKDENLKYHIGRIHDTLINSFKPMTVPVRSDGEIGRSWGQLELVEEVFK